MMRGSQCCRHQVVRRGRRGTPGVSGVPVRTTFALCLGLLLGMATGCTPSLSTGYGASKGVLARRSINGFTTFRNAFSEAGFAERDLTRLTNRAKSLTAIVWTPTHPGGIEQRTSNWMDQWLRQPGRTLVYVIPDSGSESEYYRAARELAVPGQRMEYRRRYAELLIREHRWQQARSGMRFKGWFYYRPKVQNTLVTPGQKNDETLAGIASATARRFEWVIEPIDDQRSDQSGGLNSVKVGPGSPPLLGMNSATASKGDGDFEPLLVSEQGDAVLARITSKKWKGSQMLVVAGGSQLTNYGLTLEANRRLADFVVRSCGKEASGAGNLEPGKGMQVGFTSAIESIPVSEQVGEIPRAVGAELLTVFPISFVTVHLAILGFVICLILMPVFGRPRRVDRGVLTDFGDHLDAVANLMRRRGGERLARSRISEYFRRVRKESSGPWVIDEPRPIAKPVASDKGNSEPASRAPEQPD